MFKRESGNGNSSSGLFTFKTMRTQYSPLKVLQPFIYRQYIYIRNGSMAEHRSHMCQLGLCQYRNRVVETHCSRILSIQCLHLWATCRDKKVKRGNQFQKMEHLLQMCMALSFWDSSRYGISINTVQDFPVTSR